MSEKCVETVSDNCVEYVGRTFSTKTCGDVVVLKHENDDKVQVRFSKTGSVVKTTLRSLLKGSIKDREQPSVFGVGVVGEDKICTDGVLHADYRLWVNILNRCYKRYKRSRVQYEGCIVSENFKYFPYFRNWCANQKGYGSVDDFGHAFAIDKDILVKGNRIYSEDTCCFVPREINNLLNGRKNRNQKLPTGVHLRESSGKYIAAICKDRVVTHIGVYTTSSEAFEAYKVVKETYIKEVADKWKAQIDPRVYEVLMDWNVTYDE